MTADSAALTRPQVRDSLARERGKLLAALDGLSEKEMTRPGAVGRWSVRDVLAHILAWEDEAVTRLDLLAADRPQDIAWIGDDEELETWNDSAHQRYSGLALAEVMRRLTDAQGRILAGLDSLSEERLTTDAGPVPVRRWLPGETYAHEQEHCADILAWRRSIETSET
jgi:uncharacterized damage-inducible protein DinB